MQQLASNLVSFASQIDQNTIDQAKETALMPFIHPHIALMPDAHSGRGSAVGTVIPTKGAVIPAAVGVDIGCVDADTEFWTGAGWKRIAEYNGEGVLQYWPETGTADIVRPQRYLVRDQEWFYHLKTKYGIDQMLTPDHRMLVWEIKGRKRDRVMKEISAQEFVDRHGSLVQGYKAEIETTFRLPENHQQKYGQIWTPETARVQVMTAADSYIMGETAILRLKKARKIERAQKLLAVADIRCTVNEQADGVTTIRYRPQVHYKGLHWFWGAPSEILSAVSDELLYWDGNSDDQSFFTRDERDADMAQYAHTASGYRSSKRADVHPKDGKIDYRVFRMEKTKIGVAGVPKSEITKVSSIDGKAYCFTVPSGFLVLRRAGCIFVTGNCGMSAVKTRFTWAGVEQAKAELGQPVDLKKLREAIEDAIPVSPGNYNTNNQRFPFTKAKHEKLIMMAKANDVDLTHSPKWMEQLGSLGGGNHFIELCVDTDNNVWLFLHSGSRGVGNKIAQKHIKIAEALCKAREHHLPNRDLAYLEEGDPEFDRYISDLHWAQEFALLNRDEMMDRFIWAFARWLGVEAQRVELERIRCHHNYTVPISIEGERVWLTRKGAIDASEGKLGIIPGSMGTSSYVVRGKGSPTGLFSAPHGAGRKFSRTQAKKNFTEADLVEAMKGIEYRHGPQWIDEIPGAYKDIDVVMADAADLVEVVATLTQKLNVKGT